MALRKALQDLNNAVKDLMSLHVQTYTGKVDSTAQLRNSPFDDIRTTLSGDSSSTNIKVNLVLETLIKFDGDSYNFIDTNSAPPESVLKLHKDAVDSGIQTRMGLMEFVSDVFK